MAMPLVSCIMPTYNRRAFCGTAMAQFLAQDYGERELIVIDDGEDAIEDLVPRDARIRYFRLKTRSSLGAKRNLACRYARGEFVMHWDDDDWCPPQRITRQMGALLEHDADVTGLAELYFFDAVARRAWKYRYRNPRRDWVAGGTMLYRKAFWAGNPFPAITIGEDARFLWNAPRLRLHVMEDLTLYAARIHGGNSSAKCTRDPQWQACPYEELPFCPREETAAQPATPLVSCLMPTSNRRQYVPSAIAMFLKQDYPSKELVVVDDGTDAVADLIPDDPSIRYQRLTRRETVGAKRNVAARLARGEYLVHWDDDDWFAPARLRKQLAPLFAGEADVSALAMRYVLTLPSGEFYRCPPDTHRQVHYRDMCCGTIAYARRLWTNFGPYPALNCAEDVRFLLNLPPQTRMLRLADETLFVCVRHGANTWTIPRDWRTHPMAWERIAAPEFYQSVAELAAV